MNIVVLLCKNNTNHYVKGVFNINMLVSFLIQLFYC